MKTTTPMSIPRSVQPRLLTLVLVKHHSQLWSTWNPKPLVWCSGRFSGPGIGPNKLQIISMLTLNLHAQFINVYPWDALVQQMKNSDNLVYPWSYKDRLLFFDSLPYVSDKPQLYIQLVREYHSVALAVYTGVNKTIELLSQNFFIYHAY